MGKVTEADVRKLLKNFIGEQDFTLLAKVTAVDENALTCTLDNDGVEIFDVRIMPVTGNANGIRLIPKLESYVLACKIENSEQYMINGCSEIDKWLLTINGKKLSVTTDGFVFNDGEKGLVKIDKMISWMQKVYTDLQTLKTLLSVTPVAGNGAPLGIVFTPGTNNAVQSDFEDTLIKH